VITHADRVTAPELAALREELEALHPGAPVLESAHRADHLLDVRADQKRPLSHLKGRSVAALSAIGDPLSFETGLESLGVEVAQRWRYPDHHAFSERELRSAEELRGGLPLVTTLKDFARFPDRWDKILTGETYVLGVKLEILKGRNIWIDTLDRLAKEAEAA